MVKVVAEGESFDFDEKVNGLTNYFKDLKEFEGDKDSFELKTIKKVDVSRVLEACKTANYEFKDVNKVSGSDANAYIGQGLTKFFVTLSPSDLNTLFKAAKELRLNGLQNNIAAFLASKVYIKLNLQEYNKKKAELGVKTQLTPQVSKQLRQKYAFLNN